MKKLLGISLIAVLTAAPAFAVPTPETAASAEEAAQTTTAGPLYKAAVEDENNDGKLVTSKYVKGAYNAAMTAVNNAYTAAKDYSDNNLQTAKGYSDNNLQTAKGYTDTEVGKVKNNIIGGDDSGVKVRAGDTQAVTVQAGLQQLSSAIDNLDDGYATVKLDNIDADGIGVIDGRVVEKAQDGTITFANAEERTATGLENSTVGAAIKELAIDYKAADTALDQRITTNANNIETLNGSASVTGSVENKIKLNAASADYDLTGKNYTDGTAATVTGALDDLNTRVNTNTTHIGTMGDLTGAAAGKDDLVQAINAVSSSMTDDFATKESVGATISNSTVTALTTWESDATTDVYVKQPEGDNNGYKTAARTRNADIED